MNFEPSIWEQAWLIFVDSTVQTSNNRPLLLDNLLGPMLHYSLVHLQDPQPFIFLAILYMKISSTRDKNIMTKKKCMVF